MDELQKKQAVENALVSAFFQHSIKPLDDSMGQITAKLTALGVTASVSPHGYVELTQTADGTPVVLSAALERVRKELPDAFVSDPRRDAITSREDFRGSPQDIAVAKAQYIRLNPEKWETLPQTRAEAVARAIVPSAEMNRTDYLKMKREDRAYLAGVVGPEGSASWRELDE